jgi:hypothetical protein
MKFQFLVWSAKRPHLATGYVRVGKAIL